MDIRPQQRQQQRLLINLSMRQAFAVLKLPILELAAFVEEQIEANPLLEKAESAPFVEASEMAAPLSLYRYLMEQVERGDFEEAEKRVAEEIIGNLDERGFYTDSTVGKKGVLKKVQQLDPPGIGATSLQESLLLQLEARGEKGSKLYKKIRDDFGSCGKEIRGLNMAPGLSFQAGLLPPLFPDVVVDEAIHVSDEGIPEFQLSPHYALYLEKGVEERYLRNHLAEAKWLLRNLEKRASTLEAITRFLLEKGEGYFRGSGDPLPKTSVKEMAEKLDLNPSTISRAIADKSLLSMGGHVPFKAFFAKDEPKVLLRELIAKEVKPQSDEELGAQLGVARRTVAKYRKELGIPSSRKRQ